MRQFSVPVRVKPEKRFEWMKFIICYFHFWMRIRWFYFINFQIQNPKLICRNAGIEQHKISDTEYYLGKKFRPKIGNSLAHKHQVFNNNKC